MMIQDWTKVITQPLGIAGFALSLVSGLAGSLIKASNRGRLHWIVPATFFLAVLCICWGLWLEHEHELIRAGVVQSSIVENVALNSAAPPACTNWNPLTKVCHGCEFRVDQKGLLPNGKLPPLVCPNMATGSRVYAEFIGGIGTDSPQIPSFTDVAITLQGSPPTYRAGAKNGGHPILSGEVAHEESVKEGESRIVLQLGECQFGQAVADTCWVDGIVSVVEKGFHLH